MKYISILMSTLAILIILTNYTPILAQDEKQARINIAMPNWDSGRLAARHLAIEIKQAINIESDFVDISLDDAWVELDKKDGEIDIYPEIWLPNQIRNWSRYINDRKTVSSNITPYIGEQNIYFLKTNNLPETMTVDLLKNDDIVDKFDIDSDGKGEYWPSEKGWGSYALTQIKFRSYGLDDLWEPLSLSTDEFLELLADRKKNQKSILFYYWAPEWIQAEYSLGDIIEQPHTEGCLNLVELSGSDEYREDSTFKCEYPESKIHIIYRSNIKEKAKDIEKILRHFSIDSEKVIEALYVLYKNEDDMDNALAKLKPRSQ